MIWHWRCVLVDEVHAFAAQLTARLVATGFRRVAQSIDSEKNTRVSMEAPGGSVLLFVFGAGAVTGVSAYWCPNLSDATRHLCSWRRPAELAEEPLRSLVDACWDTLAEQDVENAAAGRPTWTGGLRKLPPPVVQIEGHRYVSG